MRSIFLFNKNKSLIPEILTSLLVLTAIKAPFAFADDDHIEEILVMSSRTNATLDDTPMRLQVLDAEELHEKANMKPGDIRMILNESTGLERTHELRAAPQDASQIASAAPAAP